MSFYTKVAMRLFSHPSEAVSPYFTEIKVNLKKARIKSSLQEYVSMAMLTSFLIFLFELPLLSFILAIFLKSFLFSFVTSFTISIFLTVIFFFIFINYPRVIINEKSKNLDNSLPFASLYLSTIVGSKLPLHKTFEIFSKFSKYGEITDEITAIKNDMEVFGLDVNTALERAVDRTPSKNFKELLWGILSVNRTGGDLNAYLKEKSTSFINEYRRKLYEFSHQLAMYIEIYLTSVVIGALFFTILTSIMSGIAGTSGNIIVLQFLLIFIFLPLISVAFIVMIKSATPGGE
jgi:flagellar protein FlaJ